MELLVRVLRLGVILLSAFGTYIFLSTWVTMTFGRETRELRESLRQGRNQIHRFAREQPIDAEGNDWREAVKEMRWWRLRRQGDLVCGLICGSAVLAALWMVMVAEHHWQSDLVVLGIAGATAAGIIGFRMIRLLRRIKELPAVQDEAHPDETVENG